MATFVGSNKYLSQNLYQIYKFDLVIDNVAKLEKWVDLGFYQCVV